MNVSSSQIKLATKVHKHNLANATRNPMKTVIDLPLSTEMIELLDSSLNTTDDEGYLSEAVGSHLSHPLSAMAVYCPAAAIMASKFSASRIPSPPRSTTQSTKGLGSFLFGSNNNNETGASGKQTSPTTHGNYLENSFDGNQSPAATIKTPTTRPKIDEARSRLDVLWLRRKAELAREDGDLGGAVNIIQEALDVHLGGRDYNNNTNLSRPVLSSDPRELLDTIQKDFFLFDSSAHSKAAVVQRWYHRKHTARCNSITLITKLFRGFRKRKVYNKYKEARRQCAVMLQRRFRKHLLRMHALATKLKKWYKLRKEVQEYHRKLRIYRMARRIQALFRGYRGRNKAGLKRLQFLLVRKIQRTARAYVMRRSRAWVLALFHQRFWLAARRIQTFVRKQQAVERSQMKLLLELSRESIRARKERIVVEEALRMQKIRNQYYFHTDAGRIHLQHVQRRTHVKQLSIKVARAALSEEEVLTQKLIAVLEEYDTDGTGNIPTRRLKKVLSRALIPVDKEQLMILKQRFDPEETGQIGFTDILDWYNSEAADDLVEPDSLSDRLTQMKLTLQRKLRRLTLKTQLHQARKVLNSEQAAWLSKETIGTFRLTHAPKYQCCQCRQAFVLFTDYYVHFDGDGNCGVLQQKGMFFPRYWVKQDWRRQRQIELEVMRVNDEQPYVQYQCTMQSCTHVAHSKNIDVKTATDDMIYKVTDIYREQISTIKKPDLKKHTVQSVKDLFAACECSSATLFAAEAIVRALRLPVSKAWITDGLCPLNEMVKWLSKYLTDYADSDHSSFSDNSSSTKMSDFFKQDDPKKSKHHVEFSLQAMRPPTISDSGLMKRRARDLAEAQVQFLRALHVDTQTALFALLEFRSRKPRSITMTDDELQELGLISLTQEHYLTLQHELVSRLRRINEMYVTIYSRVPTPTCPTLRKLLFKAVPVGPSDDITGDGLFDLFLDTAHDVAQARLGCYLKSPIGAMVRRRLAADLKISKHRLLLSLVQDVAKSTKYADANSSKIISQMNVFGAEKSAAVKALELQFLFGKYCSIFQDEGIDVRDVELVAREFALLIPEADQRIVVDQLDPEGGGFIFFVYFLRWMRSDNPALYQEFSAQLRQDLLRTLQAATRSKYYFHAADVLLARFRTVQRMEVTVREGILYTDDFRADLYMHTLHVFYRRCEGGAVNEDLNARKYHILSQSTRGGGHIMLDEESLDDTGTLGHNSLLGLPPPAHSVSGLAPAAPILSASPSGSPGRGDAKHPQAESVAGAGAGAGVGTAEEDEGAGFGGEDDGSLEEVNAAAAPLLPTKEFVKPTIQGGVYDNLTKWYTLRWREEESENRVIYSVVEQRAELQYWQNIVTPVGWYNLWTERKLLQQLDTMIDATGYCMVHRMQSPPRTAGGVLGATIQEALSFYGASSVSSLASGSFQQYSATVSHVLSVKDQDSTQLYDNASISSHTHSFAGDDDDHPFAYLDPGSVQGKGAGGGYEQSIGSGSPSGPLMPMSPEPGSVTGTAIDRGGEESESDGLIQGNTNTNSILLEEEAVALTAHGRALYTAVLEMAVSVFDTDCTGDLDEGEVRVLLRCLHCALSEKAFRHTFADNDDVIRGVSVRKLINHLSERVHWDHKEVWKKATGQRQAGIGIAKRANIGCAAGILVSLQRQLAHKRALQSVKLSKIGRIVMLRESHAGSSDQTLLVRSQLFAMRQVSMFLHTTQGTIKLHHALQDLLFSWQRDVLNVAPHHAVATSGVYYVNYAYALHQEGDGVLATEIPHVVKFLVTKLRLVPTRRVEELALMFTGLRGSASDIRCLNHAEFTGLLAPLFLQPKAVEPNTFLRRLGLKRRLRRDAKLRMYSCARQQAVKIAMDFPVIEVSETNYRCSVLGLRLFIQRSLPVALFSTKGKAKAPAKEVATPVKPAKDISGPTEAAAAAADSPDDVSTIAGSVVTTTVMLPADCVPKEAVALHLLSLGYSISDLSHPCLADLLDVDHLQGHLQLVPVSLAAAVDAARKGISKTGTYFEAARRLRRKLLKYWRLHLEFKQVVRALTQYSAVVDKKGGEFLKEILTGVSHCME